MIDVSCILINYNTSAFTIDAVKSILEKNGSSIDYEIIVVDNASEKEDYSKLKTSISGIDPERVKLVRSPVNKGFGEGNMIGVEQAKECKYFAFINNDTLQTTTNCLKILQDFMERTLDAGLCSPQMLDEKGNFRTTIDHFSSLQREILRRPLLEYIAPTKYLNRKITYEEPTKVHYVQGSFMFVDATEFNAIGGFDKNLFLYYEESDISKRLLNRGKYTYLFPGATYIHFKTKSIKRNIDIKIEQKISLLYYIEKHYGWWHRHVLNTYLVVRYFFSSIVKPKYWKLFHVLLKGAPLSLSLKRKQEINLMKF